MLVSDGRFVTKSPTFPALTGPGGSSWFWNFERSSAVASYAALYRTHLWVAALVGKRARATARLPLKVYKRAELDRPEVPAANKYGKLMRQPNPAISNFRFWEWVSATLDLYGETFLLIRFSGGVPFQLVPLHPSGMTFDADAGVWHFANNRAELRDIPSSSLIHFAEFNPDNSGRGQSKLEPLRATLENEWAARTATSSMWRNGARPGMVIRHPGAVSEPAAARLKAQFQSSAAGPDKVGSTLLLEEGMEAVAVQLTAEEAQYIETRKLNREEVCAAYDVPPPVVQILDHATFSNITEQMRSMYRDTMAPHLKAIESDLDTQLRAPYFSDDVYAEFLMDEVLRGAFEQRAAAYAAADYMTPAEKRRAENLPFIEGTDQLFVNSATIPLALAGKQTTAAPAPAPEPAPAGEGEPAPPKAIAPVRTLMGRLAWQKSLADVDAESLVAGLTPAARSLVLAALADARSAGSSVADFRSYLNRQKEPA